MGENREDKPFASAIKNLCVQAAVKLELPHLKKKRRVIVFATHRLVKAQCCVARMLFARE